MLQSRIGYFDDDQKSCKERRIGYFVNDQKSCKESRIWYFDNDQKSCKESLSELNSSATDIENTLANDINAESSILKEGNFTPEQSNGASRDALARLEQALAGSLEVANLRGTPNQIERMIRLQNSRMEHFLTLLQDWNKH
ncbi:hypothetical protein R4Z09_19335 [Niallia oryzisoli]|uniref:Uncharacterized protein n=1 Tax=Niallia oryzisoli TaxID=1737571 RepID=A0ABZ2CC78_9BACI